MTEKSALEKIYALPRFQGTRSLSPMRELLEALGNPQRAMRYIHVAGTNGKGSVSTMCASILERAGMRVGLYTSPYINTFRERFMINGKPISPLAFTRAAGRVLATLEGLPHAKELAQFDAVTAIGFLLFAEAGCDIVVLECGLGGRLDATNVIEPPLAAVVTNIGLDHTAVLGETTREIAAEKAGILKPGTGAAILSPQDYPEALSVLEEAARERGVPSFSVRLADISLLQCGLGALAFSYRGADYRTRLAAPYQAKNAATAIETMHALRRLGYPISDDAILDGLLHAFIPARLELLSLCPAILIDGAHNPDGMRALQNSIEILSDRFDRLYCLVGVLEDKDPAAVLSAFFDSAVLQPRLGAIGCITPPTPRACPAEKLVEHVRGIPGLTVEPEAFADIDSALLSLLCRMGERDLLLAFGSLYSMGELRNRIPAVYRAWKKTEKNT